MLRATNRVQRGGRFLVALLLAAGLAPARAESPAAYATLGEHWEPLRGEFNRDAGKVRLLLLLDPT